MGIGGAERVVALLANAWASRGDQVTLMPTYSGRGDCFYELSPDIRLEFLADQVSSQKRTPGNRLARLCALRRFVAALRPGVIVSVLSNVNVAAVLASAGLRIPLIVCERIDPFVMPTPPLLRMARRCTYRFADALIVQTHAVAAKCAASGWTLRRLVVIPNPVPPWVLDIRRRDPVERRKRLLSIGRLDEQKQFDLLVRVFADVAGRCADWSLRIVGEGPLHGALQHQITELGVADRVEMPGPTEAVGAELAEADAFVLTSRYEGFPNALLEAMAAGLPCATLDCPSGPREITMDGQVALLVPPDDEPALGQALMRLMSDERLRQDLGNRAQASVLERFSLDRVMAQWDSLFEVLGVGR